MKNYKFVFGAIFTSVLISGAQAANIKEMATTPPSPLAMKDAASVTARTGAPYHFVDAELAPVHTPAASSPLPGEITVARVAGALDKAPAQSFAGGPVAAAHASPAKSGLTSTQAAASNISEPATELLLLLALSALAIVVRRQSPT